MKGKIVKIMCSVMMIMIIMGIHQGALAQKKLHFWTSHYNVDLGKWFEEVMFPAFEKENPGVKVEMLVIPWGPGREAKILSAFAGGTPPDVLQGGSEMIWDRAVKRMSTPLDEYWEKYPEKDKFYPIAIEARTLGRRLYSIPTHLAPRALGWNKDIFEEVGLDPDEPPDTWEEIEAAAKKCNIVKGNKVVRWGFEWSYDIGADSYNQALFSGFYQNGGRVIEEDYSKSLLYSPENVGTLEWLKNLYDELRPPGAAVPEQVGETPLFQAGKIAIDMVIPQTHRLQQKYAPAMRVGVTAPRGPKDTGSSVLLTCHNGLYIPPQISAERKDLAWKFVTFFVDSRWLGEYNKYFSTVSPRIADKEHPYVKDSPFMGFFYEALAKGKGVLWPQLPEHAKLLKIVRDQIEAVYELGKSPDKALKEAHEEWNKIIKATRKPPGLK